MFRHTWYNHVCLVAADTGLLCLLVVGKRGFLAHPLTANFWPIQGTPGGLPGRFAFRRCEIRHFDVSTTGHYGARQSVTANALAPGRARW